MPEPRLALPLRQHLDALLGALHAAGWRALAELPGFYRALSWTRRHPNPRFRTLLTFPRLTDRTVNTPVDATYFYQDTWAAGAVLRARPARHVDIGSSVTSVGIISQLVPTTFIDIRPIEVSLPGLVFMEGSILDIPMPTGSVSSLSSLCVVEHVGLGRYGDPLDEYGSEKAASELSRVLAPGGHLYVSLPVDRDCRIYFNAHRAFTRQAVIEMFPDLQLVEERYQYGNTLQAGYDAGCGFGTGLFLFRKALA